MNSLVTQLFGISLVALLTTIAGGQTPAPRKIEGVWEKVTCPFDSSKALLPVTCGRLRVPENYDEANGRTIEVAVLVVSAPRKRSSDDAVIFLSGGPGSPALVHVETLVATEAIREVVVDRDWVFFDQRGGGRSVPALFCQPDPDYVKQTKNCRDQLVRQGIDLSQYNSKRISQDMEALRKALGLRQWNVWGASYGSRLAFTYARYYPATTRTLLIDGPYMPEEQERVSDLQGAEIVINKIFSKCYAEAACAARYPDLRGRFLAALPRLRQQPLAAENGQIDDERVMDFMIGTLYGGAVPTFERRVQTVLAYADAAARGDGQVMLQIEQKLTADTPPRPQLPEQARWHEGQNASIDCHEEKAFESIDEYVVAASRSEMVRSQLGPRGGQSSMQRCALWGAGRADPVENTRVYYDGPILALTGELDPTLSGAAGYKIEMIYANARHVVFRNAGHVQFYIRTYNYSEEELPYRRCALELGRQFLSDPRATLDTRCSDTRKFRLAP